MATTAQCYTVRLRKWGQLTIPQEVRDSLATNEGEILTLIQMDDLRLLTLRPKIVSTLTQKFTAEMDNAKVSLADLLQGLAEEREAICKERGNRDSE